MRIRRYRAEDAPLLARIFYETVHSVNGADYTPAQLHAWAPEVPDAQLWHARMSRRHTLVAEEDGEPIAFAELEPDGHLDMFYCHKRALRRGTGTRLYHAVECVARELGLERIFTEASITARAFFEHQGYRVKEVRTVVQRGAEVTNYAMEKALIAGGNHIVGPSGGSSSACDVGANLPRKFEGGPERRWYRRARPRQTASASSG